MCVCIDTFSMLVVCPYIYIIKLLLYAIRYRITFRILLGLLINIFLVSDKNNESSAHECC